MGLVEKIKSFIKGSVGFLTKKGKLIDYDEAHALAYGFLEENDQNKIGEELGYPSYVKTEQHYYLFGKDLRKELEKKRNK